jgi:ADP-ribose pyrophosphatase
MSANPKEMPQVIASEIVFHGKVFDVTTDTVREGEQVFKRDVVRHRGSAAMVPVFSDGRIALVRQYRHAAAKRLLEIPAGTIDAGEDAKSCAARELVEEMGLRAGRLERLCEFYVSPGFLSEKMYVYLATDLIETQAAPEEDENLEIVYVDYRRAVEMIAAGEIEDAKTIIGIMRAALHLGYKIDPVNL